MENEIQTQQQPDRDTVATRAYQLWEAAGKPVGRDMELWLQAETEVNAAKQKHQSILKPVAPVAPEPASKFEQTRTDQAQKPAFAASSPAAPRGQASAAKARGNSSVAGVSRSSRSKRR